MLVPETQGVDDLVPLNAQVILEHIQEKDVGQLMRGMTDASDHAHSGAAFGILKDYHIGSLNDKPR